MEQVLSPILTTHPREFPAATRHNLRAVRIAPGAIEALRAGSRWKVLSVHRRALNFIDPAGRLLSFTQDPIRMGPFSIELESASGDIRFADAIRAIQTTPGEQPRVFIGGRSVDLTSAAHWNPRPDWSALLGPSWQPRCLPVLLGALRDSAPRESLACVAQTLGTHTENVGDAPLQQLPQAVAAKSAVRLIQALGKSDLQGAAWASAALAGTGLGLTPSGDDFLIGVMFGVHSAFPGGEARAITSVIRRASVGRTNCISDAWLSAAAEGQAIQAWHELVDSIGSHDDAKIDRACRSLITLGHTSGADALTGFAAFHLARASTLPVLR